MKSMVRSMEVGTKILQASHLLQSWRSGGRCGKGDSLLHPSYKRLGQVGRPDFQAALNLGSMNVARLSRVSLYFGKGRGWNPLRRGDKRMRQAAGIDGLIILIQHLDMLIALCGRSYGETQILRY